MADPKEAAARGGSHRTAGGGGGKGRSGGPRPETARNARLAGEDPSPDDRARGERSKADRDSGQRT